MSTFMDKILFTVSIKVSPFLRDDMEDAKFITSADNLFCASSNDNLVRVLFSKKRLAMVMSRNEGTFLIGRLITSLNWVAVSKISWISASVRYLIPNKCFTLNSLILFFYQVYCILIIFFLPTYHNTLVLNCINLSATKIGLYGQMS